MILNNKEILYIGPEFFGYEVEIQKTLKELGATVDFYDDRPKNDFITKVLIRINLKRFIKNQINKYYEDIYTNIKQKEYDFIFVVAPETLDYEKLTKIKNIQTNSFCILYMWDSFKNKNSFNIISLFDKVITFDNNDAGKYDLEFLALFYIKEYENIREQKEYKYDICFIATAHSDRYKIAKSLEKDLKDLNKLMFLFIYLPSKIMYWVRKLFIGNYKYGNINDFSFISLSQKEIINKVVESKVVLDINHPLQYGLTSRSVEAFGANRKLITTNKNIKDYDFYNENNIFIIDREYPKVPVEFFDNSYEKPSNEMYEYYSLKSWLVNIFKDCKQ